MGKTLGLAPRAAYYREPCHPGTSYQSDDTVWSRYVPPQGDDPHFRRCLTKAFSGQFVGDIDAGPGAVSLRKHGHYRVVVKEVACFLSVEWLYQKWAPEIVIVTRHPCPSAVSVQNLGLAAVEGRRYHELIANPLLRDVHFAHLSSHLENIRSPIEVSAAIWAIKNTVAYAVSRRYPLWMWVSYEDVCAQPVRMFEELYRRLGLEWTPQVESAIVRSTTNQAEGAHATSKVSAAQVARWRQVMAPDDIKAVRRVVEPFDFPFYRNAEDWP